MNRTTRTTTLLAAVLLLSTTLGCSGPTAQSQPTVTAQTVAAPTGQPSDLLTEDGDYDGYRVTRACESDSDVVAVQGVGDDWFPGLEPPDFAGDLVATDAFRAEIMPALSSLTSIHTSGFGHGCTQVGFFIEMSDWTEVDEAIRLIGERLSALDVREEVTIRVFVNTAVLQ